jgi:hypothetical protein
MKHTLIIYVRRSDPAAALYSFNVLRHTPKLLLLLLLLDQIGLTVGL